LATSSAMVVVTITSLILLRFRRYLLSVNIFVAGLMLMLCHVSYSGAGVMSVSYLSGSSVVIVFAGLFIGFRVSLIYFFLIAVEGIALMAMKNSGYRSFHFMVKDEGAIVIMIIFILGLIAAIKTASDIYNSYLEKIREKEDGLIRLLAELRESKSELERINCRLNDIIEFIPDPTFVIDVDKKVVAWNRAIELITGIEKEKIIGKGEYSYAIPFFREHVPMLIDMLDTEYDENNPRYKYIQRDGDKVIGEIYLQDLNDRKGVHLWAIAGPLFDTDGRRTGSIEVIHDVSARRESESELKNALKQKEVLIKELFHRTKNNMQIISSMLRLKARRIDDLSMRRTLIEIENKILSIALVHQKLYDSKNLSEIDLGDYINEIVSMMRTFPGFEEKNIDFLLSLEKKIVLIDIAIPCGLILNELITNSLKYAFDDKNSGTISISLSTSDKGIVLIYEDSGKGFDDDYDPDTSSHIGFSIIREMATRQLMGEFSVMTKGSFRCELVIPVNKSNRLV
ncbi:MAG TPA: histidine kinase dimerization/phosphoacceptor domain -containing protein, partial [Spirochaetota bacterium]|nr:histidine kinase dimerization/phosphoacceptor domain -containing protein [Spirochaetota bacterium]